MRFLLYYFFFFLSGVTMLLYEVAWQRMLGTVFGATTTATATILAVFFGGIACGSIFFMRRASRSSPRQALRAYAALQCIAGIWAVSTPWFLGKMFNLRAALEPSVFSTHLSQFSPVAFFLAFLFFFLPTFAVGGTFPLMVRAAEDRTLAGSYRPGALYALNTFGGALGALLAGFYLLERIGVSHTIFVAALVDIVSAAVLWSLASALTLSVTQEAPASLPTSLLPVAQRAKKTILAALLCFGACFLGLEVLWTRFLTLVIGGAIYAFSIMLVSILLGVALGGLATSLVLRKLPRPVFVFFMLALMLGASVAASSFFYDRLPGMYGGLLAGDAATAFDSLAFSAFGVVSLVTLLPSLLAGAIFPLGVRILHDLEGQPAKPYGAAFGLNVLGGVIGPIVVGAVLIPHIGMQRSVLLIAFLYGLIAALGIAILIRRHTVVIAAVTVLGITAVIAPAWSRTALTSGTFLYGAKNTSAEHTDELLYYKEGPEGVVSVRKGAGELSLAVNGKVIASQGGDRATELLLGHLPALLTPHAHDALVVGVGSGITTGALLTHPELAHIDQVEIEPAVLEAAAYFVAENNHALQDPRVRTIVGDARHFLLRTNITYDIITAEPSNPWIGGMANLFTQDYYRLAKSRLKPNGIFLQWVPYYRMAPGDVQMIVRTFTSVFPHVTLWMNPGDADMFLVGSAERLVLAPDDIVREFSVQAVAQSLKKIYIVYPADLFRTFLMDEDAVRAFALKGPLHTDDHPYLEFSAPRSLYAETRGVNASLLKGFLSDPLPYVADAQRLNAAFRSLMQQNLSLRTGALDTIAGAGEENLR